MSEKELADRVEELSANNQRLAAALRDAREQILSLKEDVERLGAAPNPYGTFIASAGEGLADVHLGGRKMRVNTELGDLETGAEVLLNEAMNVIGAGPVPKHGEVVMYLERVGEDQVLVQTRGDAEHVVLLAEPLRQRSLRPGDSLVADLRSGLALEVVKRSKVEDLMLEEVPDVDYSRIGGLGEQIRAIRDAVELPFLHPELYASYQLRPPKGILLYGPPGCGKTLIAKAVAHSLAENTASEDGAPLSYFINIKGPELLNKYVGESERQIRNIFQRAREKASAGYPVIVFFDEMDSLFRTRGTGISSDVETTIVPQLLSEIDGVESLRNVVVIGATNREDMIDPAILRPGRLDVKIRVERPDAIAAADIFAKYLTTEVPLHPSVGSDPAQAVADLISAAVAHMYAESEENRFLEVTYITGERETLYFHDFTSGAMIENVVARAKKLAIKEQIAGGEPGLRLSYLLGAIREEFRENEDLPNTTNPDDWARISGKKGEQITFMRTLTGVAQAAPRPVENIGSDRLR